MARQISSIKIIGTVDGINFYQEEEDYLAREKPGVDTRRFLKDEAFARSRASSKRFGKANTIYSLVYRYVMPGYRCRTLNNLCRKKAIALAGEGLSQAEVLLRLYRYLHSLNCIAISKEDFEQMIPALLKEAEARENSTLQRQKKVKKEKATIIMREKPTEEDKELLTHEEYDFEYDVVFAGEFHKDYEIPISIAMRIKDRFKGLKTVLLKPKEKIIDEWVKME